MCPWEPPIGRQPLSHPSKFRILIWHHASVPSEPRPRRTIWPVATAPGTVAIIDQRRLPDSIEVATLSSLDQVATAIRDMWVRGAGCIGATAAYGVYVALAQGVTLGEATAVLTATRPTAVNLTWALDQMARACDGLTGAELVDTALRRADEIAADDVDRCRRIGEHGVEILERLAGQRPGRPVNVLTHCNAGWLAFVEHGSATAPIYAAHERGLDVHVWVDETRPRNQGSRLTAWELGEAGVAHTIVVDNAGGHLMQRGLVDVVITGSDRATADGDVGNKIGTYLKALAAHDNGVPFYAAMPASTIDWALSDGVADIPIEERSGEEVSHVEGTTQNGSPTSVRVVPMGSDTANPGFDVTPARLVTGIITERGVCPASRHGLAAAHPESPDHETSRRT